MGGQGGKLCPTPGVLGGGPPAPYSFATPVAHFGRLSPTLWWAENASETPRIPSRERRPKWATGVANSLGCGGAPTKGAPLAAFPRRYGGPSRTLGTELGEVRAKKFARIAEFPAVKSFIGTRSPPSCPLLAVRFRIERCRASAQDPPRFCPVLIEPSIWGAGPGPRPGVPREVRFASDFKGSGLGFFPPSPHLLLHGPGPDRHMEGSNNAGQVLRAGLAPGGSESARLSRSWQAS